jgi:hypothetical protein
VGSHDLISRVAKEPRIYRLLCHLNCTFESILVCEIEYDKNTISFFVVAVGEREKFLLSSCIPDANSDLAVFDPHQLLLEAQAKSGSVEMAEGG